MHGQGTILFLDEIHRFSKSQQDALLPAVEEGIIVLIGATTENPYFEVNAPLRSRSTLFRLEPLDEAGLEVLIRRGVEALGYEISPEAVELLVARSAGDGRQILTSLDVAAALADGTLIGIDEVQGALSTTAFRYGRDDHYDVVSAFIKSVRGSDVQASIFYLARMLEAGEDPRFIARRMIILASEDVGLADPQALVVAVAAAQAVEYVGLPEAQLNLAQATVYLASAPKSNSVAQAVWTARAELADGVMGEVPAHLRDGHYAGAAALGHGRDYQYPHDYPKHWVQQQYLPDALLSKKWYQPSENGFEENIGKIMEALEIQQNKAEGTS
jgi:putative ATPase